MTDNDDGDQDDDGGDVVVDGQDKPRQCVSQIDTNPLTLRKKIKANVLVNNNNNMILVLDHVSLRSLFIFVGCYLFFVKKISPTGSWSALMLITSVVKAKRCTTCCSKKKTFINNIPHFVFL